MRTRTKIWLITAASLVLIGCILFVGVMTMLGWDFMRLETVKYETNTYEIIEVFDSIYMSTDTADISFALSDDGNCRVVCHEDTSQKHSVTVKDGELIVESSQHGFIGHIGLNFSSPRITVYLPDTEYASLIITEHTGDIKVPGSFAFKEVNISLSTGNVDFLASTSDNLQIKASTGDIWVESISVGSLHLSVSTGKITVLGVDCDGELTVGVSTSKAYLTDITCKSVISNGHTGDISLERVIAAEKLYIERSTGDVKLNRCDAGYIYIKTSTGDVKGSLLSSKIFIVNTNTGKRDVPQTSDGGKCEISTSTGDIIISLVS